MPQETPIQQADHTLAEPARQLIAHVVYETHTYADENDAMEDFLYFLVCTTSLDARDLVKAIEQFTARKEG